MIKNQKGMSLIEIMVVIAIIGLVGGVTSVYVAERFDEAKVDTAKNQMKAFEQVLEHYRRDAGFYPTTDQGLQALLEKPSFGRIPKRYPSSGYMKEKTVPRDPFDCEYQYYSPGLQGHEYEIYSLGRDCEEGGDGVDGDIASLEIE